jgi:hypothetical protein
MKKLINALRRPGLAVIAFAFVVAAATPALLGTVFAAGQVQNRSIQMSNSTAGATGVTYKVTFTPVAATAQSLVIDFCSNSAIIGAACTAPTGMNASTATLTTGTGTTNWVIGAGSASQVRITKGTGSALPATPIDFEIVGVTNYTTAGSFFARVYTYSDATYGTYANAGSIGNDVDYGGFALSTTNAINITAIVQETLTFCVSKVAPTPGCTGLTSPDLVLGHGSPQVLDSTQIDTDTAHTQISTNATSGAVVNMKNTSSTACAGLSRDGGATCGITSIGAFAAMQSGSASGTSAFGLNVANGTDQTGGGTFVGSSSADTDYGTAVGSYGMAAATFGTYGDPILTTDGTVCANVDNQLTFAATASTTTPAGVYTVTESLIATGTF